MNEQTPLPYRSAVLAEVRCIGRTIALLRRRRVRLHRRHVGRRLHFADGTSALVYRETRVEQDAPLDPCVLVVEFRLRGVRGLGHRLFRWESLLNTPLFVGFPGFVSKLWLANDQNDVYRGFYERDGPTRAEHYARSLWRVLALGCVPSSIHYHVIPNMRRDSLLDAPQLPDGGTPHDFAAWWQLVQGT